MFLLLDDLLEPLDKQGQVDGGHDRVDDYSNPLTPGMYCPESKAESKRLFVCFHLLNIHGAHGRSSVFIFVFLN